MFASHTLLLVNTVICFRFVRRVTISSSRSIDLNFPFVQSDKICEFVETVCKSLNLFRVNKVSFLINRVYNLQRIKVIRFIVLVATNSSFILKFHHLHFYISTVWNLRTTSVVFSFCHCLLSVCSSFAINFDCVCSGGRSDCALEFPEDVTQSVERSAIIPHLNYNLGSESISREMVRNNSTILINIARARIEQRSIELLCRWYRKNLRDDFHFSLFSRNCYADKFHSVGIFIG